MEGKALPSISKVRIRESCFFSKKGRLCPLSHGFATPPLRPNAVDLSIIDV